jgi:hypothetical protein
LWWLSTSIGIAFVLAVAAAVVIAQLNHSWWYDDINSATSVFLVIAVPSVVLPAFVGFCACILIGKGDEKKQNVAFALLRIAISGAASIFVGYFMKSTLFDSFLWSGEDWNPVVMCVVFLLCWVSVTLPFLVIPSVRSSSSAGSTMRHYRIPKRTLVAVSSTYLLLWFVTVLYGRPTAREAIKQMTAEEIPSIQVEWTEWPGLLGHPEAPVQDDAGVFLSKGLASVPFVVFVDATGFACGYISFSHRYVYFWFFGWTWGRDWLATNIDRVCAA